VPLEVEPAKVAESAQELEAELPACSGFTKRELLEVVTEMAEPVERLDVVEPICLKPQKEKGRSAGTRDP
jgi:hypothetical protein